MKAPCGRRSMIRHLAAPRRRATAVESLVRRSRGFASECGSAQRQRCLLNPEWTCRNSTHKVGPPTPLGYFEEGGSHSRTGLAGGTYTAVEECRGIDRARLPVLRRVSSELRIRRCTPTLPAPCLAWSDDSAKPRIRRAHSRGARPNDGFPIDRQSSARPKRQETWNAPRAPTPRMEFSSNGIKNQTC